MATPSSNSRIALVSVSTPLTGSRDDRGLDRGRLGAEQHARQVDRVAADVEQRPAARLELVPDVRRVVVVVREPALDRAQPADPAGCDELHGGDPRRVVAVHERLHQPDAGGRAGLDHPLARRRRSWPAASRTGRACRHGPRRSSTRRGGGSAAGCRRRRRRGRRGAPRTSRGRVGMPSSSATVRAWAASREAIATTSQRSALRMPGMTFLRAMSAVDRTPQRRLVIVRSVRPAASGSLRHGHAGRWTSLSQHLEERNTNPVTMRLEAVGQRSETVRRANLSAIVRELHAGGPPRARSSSPAPGLTRSAIRGLIGELSAADLVSEERAAPPGVPGRPSPVVRLDPARRRRPRPRDRGRLARRGRRRARRRGPRARSASIARSGHTSVEAIAADLAELAADLRSRRPARRAAGRRRRGGRRRRPAERRLRVDGAQPRLARRAARRRARRRPRRRRSRSRWPTTRTSAPWPSCAAAPRSAADHVLFISGEVGVGGGLIVDGQPLTGAAGYGGEVGHMPVNPNGVAVPLRLGRLLGDRGRRGGAAAHGRPPDRAAVAARSTRCCARPRPARRRRLSALDHVGRWLGHRAGRPRQHPQPAS